LTSKRGRPTGRGKKVDPVLPPDAHASLVLLANRQRLGTTPNEVARHLILRALSDLMREGMLPPEPIARHDYVIERAYPDAGSAAGVHVESGRLVAYDDAEAIKEAAVAGPKMPAFIRVKKVTPTSDIVIYDSRRAAGASDQKMI
jgi:hypothetical protein